MVEQKLRPNQVDLLIAGAKPLGWKQVGHDLIVDNVLAEEVMHDDPLVMPSDQPLRLLEKIISVEDAVIRHLLSDLVVEPDEDGLKLGDDEVFVVARIANQGALLRVALEVAA